MGGFGLRVYRIFVASYAWGSFYRERISRYDGIQGLSGVMHD